MAYRSLGRSNNRYIIFKQKKNNETITNSREPKDTKKKSLAMSYIYIAIITMLYNDLMKNSVIYLYW